MLDDQKEQLIADLGSTQEQVSVLLASVAEDQDWQPDPGEWSFRYIAAHLATVDEDCFMDRIVRISAGENPHYAPYFNTGWDFSRFDLKDSLQHWSAARGEIFDLVRALSEEEWLLTGTHDSFGTITVGSVLQVMLNHDREHLEHLKQLIEGYRV